MAAPTRLSLFADRRGFTRLEFSLLAAMLLTMVVNGVATLGGGGRPMGLLETADKATAAMKR